MCGICVCISFLHNNSESSLQNFIHKDIKSSLQNRGPDYFEEFSSSHHNDVNLFFCCSVLHLRGSSLMKQPVRDKKRNCFLWNGEIFGGNLVESSTESDTEVLAKALFKACDKSDVVEILSSIEGPYAFIFYQANGLLWFGRDIFGRRSLLWNFENSSFNLCSVACGRTKWNEVPAIGIFCIDLNHGLAENKYVVNIYPWSSSASGNILKEETLLQHDFINDDIILKINSAVQTPISKPLNRTVDLDSTYLDLMADLHNCNMKNKDLLDKILNTTILLEALNDFENILSDSVRKRVQNYLGLCKNCYLKKAVEADVNCDHASVGVLFSGGLDSIVIACLVDRHLPNDEPIDLINVAFTSSSNKKGNNQQKDFSFDTPDRITGRNGLKELKIINPSRKWNFVEVNISMDELRLKRKDHISNLLIPSCTVLDDSIGCALWFASQGKGYINIQDECCAYASPVRVLLVGMGADEQLAGYSRHRAKFNTGSWTGLIEELSLELDRIGSRNLGRDDRIIADNGVESRYPFLDEHVVSFLNSLPVWMKANLNFSRGIGEKLLLRLLAFRIGLTEGSVLPKRAIQFGSRIAKIENNKEKGSDVCERLNTLKC